MCWGQNLSGQLGDGSRTDARFPRAVGGGLTFRSLVAGWNHTCGLTANGNAFCWGLNGDGQLGDGSRLDRLVPTLVRGAIESLAAGSAHTCGISEGQVLCWGDNRFGQLGDGSNDGRAQPTAVVGLPSPPTQVTAGAVHTCALVGGGAAYCWGQNLQGQLGDGTTSNRNTAVAVSGGHRFRSIHSGGAMTCGVTMDGAQLCWGLNQSGQLGDGTRQSRSTPTAASD
jgi:alpha-tubulin suppressor-like RCC1 family protein